MSLTSGTRLGSYEVIAPLGVGGMGEVYRAKDTKLGREVALKILPAAFAQDTDRLARFKREAQVLAALNHPNIAQIYGLEDRGASLALVMELVEGPTLADLIAGMPISDALAIATQIAGALEAAHERGIIHRDLKPANVKVREDGTVKVLDFGLAKAMEPATAQGGSASASASMSPTITSPAMTQMGMILGTAAYMAPEQAKGRVADRRADIWAFGVVLFEMLAGTRAFDGEDVAEILGAVVRLEPKWEALPADVPPRVRTALRACLQKDPKQRFHDIADVRLALGGAFESERHEPSAAAAAVPPIRRFPAWPWVAAPVLMLATGLATWAALGRPPSVEPERLSIVAPVDHPIAFGWNPGRSLAISPDGTTVVYVARTLTDAPASSATARTTPQRLRVRSVGSLDTREIPGTDGARQPFFSPDGRWIGFFTEEGDLRKVALAGGSPVTLVSRINGAIWGFGAWTDAGEIIFSVTEGGLSRVSADGGTPESLTKVDASRDENRHAFPMFVEGTRTILFSVTRLGAPAPRIEAVQLDTGARQVVVDNAVSARYLDSGHLLFQRDEAILVAPFDRERLVLSGSAVPLVDAVRRDGASSEGRVAQLAVSRDGTLAFIPDANTLQTLVRVERDGRSEPLDLPANQYDKLSVSPNGQYLAVEIVRGRDIEVHVRDFERGTTTRVTPSGGSDAGPSWRPDNRAITATSRTPDGNALFLKELGGAERLIQRVEPGTIVRNTSWSPDGRHLAYTVQRGSEHDIWVLSVGDTVEAQPLLSARYSEHSPSFSPDGRWLAYVSDESGRAEVWVKQYPQGDRFPVSNGGGNGPLWRRDGKEIFFTSPSQVVAVTVAAVGDRLEFGKPTPLFSMRSPGTNGVLEQYATSGNSGRRWDILPDGRFMMARGADVSSTREIVLVQHWFEEVKRLLATR